MKKAQYIVLTSILLIAFAVRLYRFDNPVADWHSWRQADTSAVSRNFVKHGYDLFHPTYDDISNVQTGKDNPRGYRFVEFPVFNLFQAGLFQLIGIFTLEQWGRLVTIFASLGSVTFIFLLARKFANTTTAIAASLFFAIDPYSIYYGRVILPDPFMAMATLGGIWFFSLSLENKNQESRIKNYGFALLAFVFTASALLLKPFAVFFLLPMGWLVLHYQGWKGFLSWRNWLFIVFSFAPLAWWRIWMLQYPEGIPSNLWLLNKGNIRFTGAYFYWIFARRISELILGWWGIAIVMLGVLQTRLKHYGFFVSCILGSLLYLIIIARGNVQHDYYQILIIPTIAFCFGLGVDFLMNKLTVSSKPVRYVFLILTSLFLLSFGWFQIRDYFNINNRNIVIAGQAVDRLTPENAKVIAPYDGDTSFLYQTNRKGWPSFQHSLPELINLGAEYLVLVNPTDKDLELGKQYAIVESKPEYVLFNLRNSK